MLSCCRLRLVVLLMSSPAVAGYYATPTQYASRRAGATRTRPLIQSAKVIPAANVILGCALMNRAARLPMMGPQSAVLFSTGLLCLLNLAVTDNARYASAKRAVAVYQGKASLPGAAVQQRELATLWYTVCRVQVFGQLAGLLLMVRSVSPAGTLRGAAAFMLANVLFFLMGAGKAKHDDEGRPAPMKPALQQFVLTTDCVLLAAALLGALLHSSLVGALGAYLFSAGCLIGAVEGVPKTAAAIKG